MGTMNTKSKVGVFFGSRTPEHDVSIISAQLVIKGLKKSGYEVVPVYIDREGLWYVSDELGDISFFKNEDHIDNLRKHGGWKVYADTSEKMTLEKGGLFSKKVEIDVAFPVFHGEFGEDGTIQGMFEMLGVPYVGCGVASSSISMDKELTKELYTAQEIKTAPYTAVTKAKWEAHKDAILSHVDSIGLPVFVKPARAGSSIGITKVDNTNDLETAIEVAFHYDSKVLIERAVDNLVDLTCAVREADMGLEASFVQQSLYTEGLFSYEDKYINDGGTQTGTNEKGFVIPADIPSDITEKTQQISKDIFNMLGCEGMARVDFLYNKESGELFANEVNTIPGTLYHHLWKESGVELKTLLDDLISQAFRSHKERKRITRTFKSSILSSANENKLATKLQNND